MNANDKSVYALGAENGLVLGPLMTGFVLLMGASTYSAAYALPSMLLGIAVPVAAYIMLARTYRDSGGALTFSALWLQGICAFFFGAVIMSAVVAASLRWWVPGFMEHVVTQVIDTYSTIDDPAAADIASTLRTIERSNALPGPVDTALELIYAAVFSGSLLSMVYAWLIRRSKIKQR